MKKTVLALIGLLLAVSSAHAESRIGVYGEAGLVVGSRSGPGYAYPGSPGYGPAFSQKDDARLNELLSRKAMATFGPAPTSNHTWKGIRSTFERVRPGCREQRERVQGGTMVRVVCD